MIQGIAGAGIGLLVGLLTRPFLDAYNASRHVRDAQIEQAHDDVTHVVKLS